MVREYFGQLGEETMSRTQDRMFWLAGQTTGSRVLDLSCTGGILGVLLSREGFEVTVIDVMHKGLVGNLWKSRIAELKRKGLNWWHGNHQARRAVCNNLIRLDSGKGSEAPKIRTRLVEQSFQYAQDRGDMRYTWPRGQDNIQKRYLMRIAGFNLVLLMRELTGNGTQKEAVGAWNLVFAGFGAKNCWIVLILAVHEDRPEDLRSLAAVGKAAG